jgi:hypothetical protein
MIRVRNLECSTCFFLGDRRLQSADRNAVFTGPKSREPDQWLKLALMGSMGSILSNYISFVKDHMGNPD